MARKTIYIREGEEELWEKAEAISGNNLSALLSVFIRSYVNQHGEVSNIKNRLAEYLSHVADKRSELAEEHSEDKRNENSTSELNKFADWIMTLPNEDERLKTIERCQTNNDVYGPWPTASRAIFQFGFHGKEDYNSFLTWIAKADLMDWQHFQETGELNI